MAPQAQLPLILLKRPCLLIATFLIPGIVVGHYVFPGELAAWILLAPLVSAIIAFLLLATHSTFSTPASMLTIFLVGLLLGVKTDLLPRPHVYFALRPGEKYCLQGSVAAEPEPVGPQSVQAREDPERYRLIVKGEKARGAQSKDGPWRDVSGKILIYASGADAGKLQYGDKVELTGEVFLPEPRRNPGGFDFRRYLAQDGIYLCMRGSEITSPEHGHGNPVVRFVYRLKRKLRDSLSAGEIGSEEKSFLRAIILGERREVGEEFKEALRRTNTMHILAISGLHVGAIAGAVYFLLSRLIPVPQAVSSVAALVALFAYALLTGMNPPVLRSSIMYTAFLAAPLLRRRSDSINNIAFAAVAILLFRPGDLFTASFQLSFMVVLSILLLSDRIFRAFLWAFRLRPDPGFLVVLPLRRRLYRLLEYPLRFFSVCLAASIGFLPLGLYYFHSVSLLSSFCNMAVVALVGFIVPLGFLGGIMGLLARSAASFINTVNGGLIGLLQTVVTFFSAARFGSFNVSPPSAAFCLAFYSLIFLFGFGRTWRRLIVPALIMFIAFTGLFLAGQLARLHPSSIEITFLDVGQGDCIFVEFPDGGKMLVDGGSVSRKEIGRQVIVPFLRWAGVNRLDALLISHYGADHANGLQTVVEHVRTRRIFARLESSSELSATDARQAIGTKSVPIREVKAGDTLPLSAQVAAEILNPAEDSESSGLSDNDRSVVLKLSYGRLSVLLCGDIEKGAERRILRLPASPRSSVLKVPHHGSNLSSSEEFLRAVLPRVAIISCGANNIYGHPSPEALERYNQLGVRLFRTDRDGGIVVRVFRDRLNVGTTL